eukprot:2425984-Amphidinium_carterae.1
MAGVTCPGYSALSACVNTLREYLSSSFEPATTHLALVLQTSMHSELIPLAASSPSDRFRLRHVVLYMAPDKPTMSLAAIAQWVRARGLNQHASGSLPGWSLQN